MKLSAGQIHDIAEELQCGTIVYINRDTGEYKSIVNIDEVYGDTDFREEELEKIEKEWKNYATVPQMESREAFQLMEDFAFEIKDTGFRENLFYILNRKRPFAHFKSEVESSHFRQKWFDFKNEMYEEYVRERLVDEEIEFE